MAASGIWAVISPRKALESNYRWDRRWSRLFTLGLVNPKPREITDGAVRLTRALGVIFLVAGLLIVGLGFRSL